MNYQETEGREILYQKGWIDDIKSWIKEKFLL